MGVTRAQQDERHLTPAMFMVGRFYNGLINPGAMRQALNIDIGLFLDHVLQVK